MTTPTLPASPASPTPLAELVLPVEGMTCATCVNRIERFLHRAEGVSDATVNLATERASVRYDPSRIDRAGIVGAIEAAGYDVRPAADPRSAVAASEAELDAADECARTRSSARCCETGCPPPASVWR